MTEAIRYDYFEQGNATHQSWILPAEHGTPTICPEAPRLFRTEELMDRMSATGFGGEIHLDSSFADLLPAFGTLKTQLVEMAVLKGDWNSYGAEAPNEYATRAATEILDILHELELLPSRIVASADGGVSLVFLFPDGYVDIECFNEGDILAGFQLSGQPPEVEEIVLDRDSLSDLSEQIRQLGYV